MFDALLSGVAKFGSQLAGNMLTASNSARLSQRNMDYSDQLQRAYTQDQYELQKKGLIKAGYNPLLALGSSATQEALNVGTNTGGHIEGVDLFNMAQTSKLNASVIKKNDSDINRNDSDINKNDSDIYNSTRTTDANIRNQTRIANADIGLKTAQTAQMNNEALYTLAKLDMLSKQLKDYGADRMHRIVDQHIEAGSKLLGNLLPSFTKSVKDTIFPNGNVLKHISKSFGW